MYLYVVQDNMIDEDKAKAEVAAQEDTDEKLRRLEVSAESIEWFIEDQAFSSSYDLAFLPPLLTRRHVVSLSQSSCVPPVKLTDGRGQGGRVVGEKIKSLVL